MRAITASLSARFAGFCVLEHRDGIYHRIMGAGKYAPPFLSVARQGGWEKLLEVLIDNPDFKWLMIDASHVKVHPHAASARDGNQDMGRTKGGSTQRYIWPWIRMVCPLRVVVTAGPAADCTQAGELMREMNAHCLIANKGYDSDEVVNLAQGMGMQAVIAPWKTADNHVDMINIFTVCGIG